MAESSTRRLIGAHTVDAGGIHMAVRRAASAGMRALQIFTAIPKYYGEKVSVRPERVERFKAALGTSLIQPEHVVSHAAYVLNVATPDADKWERAANGLAKELERSTALGLGIVCFHPGAATDGNRQAAAERIALAMVRALEAVPNSTTRLLVENTAGAGTTMARTAEEVGSILAHIPRQHRARTGYGLDTCHLFASGYAIHESRDRLTEILDLFETAAGEGPGFFHFNDSEGDLASNRDRHVLLGDGKIGAKPFGWLLADRRTHGVPLILETPQLVAEPGDDDDTPDPYDVQMMALLGELSTGEAL
jgi:deoxyribonuclease IV